MGGEYLSFLRKSFTEFVELMDKLDVIHYIFRPIYEESTSHMKVLDGNYEQERINAEIFK